MGLIGGGPTFLGTLIGQAWVSPALEVAFFAVAGGSILYVVIQLFEVCRRYSLPTLVAWCSCSGCCSASAPTGSWSPPEPDFSPGLAIP